MDAETLNLLIMAEGSVHAANQLEQMLYGNISKRIPTRFFTDSESTLESVTSSKQIVTKTLRTVIMVLKALEDILTKNVMKIENTSINKVKFNGREVKMSNIRNRTKLGTETDTLDSQ